MITVKVKIIMFSILFLLHLLPLPVHSISNLTCISLPMLKQLSTSLYFTCICPQDRLEGQLSLATFAYNLSKSMFDRSLVVDFRDCWSLDIIMDQMDLNLRDSNHFRPDIHFEKLNIENIHRVSSAEIISPIKPKKN
jgi:hypothetical protein